VNIRFRGKAENAESPANDPKARLSIDARSAWVEEESGGVARHERH
jgi:hypothetical protein